MVAVSLITLLVLASVFTINAYDENGISKEALLAFNCSDPDRPNFCRPYGSCCGHDEFCSSVSRGCVSCFPLNLQDKPDELLQWCKELGQFNASLMNSPACTVACQARFNSSQLCIDNNTEPSSSVSWDDDNHITMYVIFGIIIFAQLMGIICLLYHILRSKRKCEQDRVELRDLGNESEVEEGKTPSELGLKERPDSPISKAVEIKSKAVPVHSNQEESEPLIDNGLGDSVKSNDSIDDSAQMTSSETTKPKTSEPQSPQENSAAHKTSRDIYVCSPQLLSESTDKEHAPVVTNKSTYQVE